MTLASSTSGTIRIVERAGLPQARTVVPPDIRSLIGTVLPLRPNAFEIRLSDDPDRALANEALLKQHPWIDIPLMINGGTIAKVTFEHGASGTPLVEEAFRAWTPPPAAAPAPPADAPARSKT